MAFAASLTKIVVSKKQQRLERQEVAAKWVAYERRLLDEAVKVFRDRCTREASQRRTQLTASFEVLTRDIEGFPTHTLQDSTYVVASWGEGASAEAWFYATHGTTVTWSSGAPVLFAEMLEGMMPKFLERLRPLGFLTCGREAGTWKVSVAWRAPSDELNGWHEEEEPSEKKTFAEELTLLVAAMNEEDGARKGLVAKWEAYESTLLEEAVDIFKQRCTREAEQSRCDVTGSFEVLSREISDFPKRVVRDSSYFVESWGGGVTAQCWFYATHGTSATFNQADPVLFADVLESMMPKFVERLQTLGFKSCGREPGTWKVSVSWDDPDESPGKKRRLPKGSAGE